MEIKTRLKQVTAAVRKSFAGLMGPEGSWRGPFWGTGENGGTFQLGSLEDGFQRNLSVGKWNVDKFAPVQTATGTISQDLSRIDPYHYLVEANGRKSKIMNKAPARVFRNPNRFQTWSDFMLFLMRSLLLDGNAYAVATRNDRFEIDALYPIMPGNMFPYLAGGEVYYRHGDSVFEEMTGLTNVSDMDRWFPQRDVLHIRLHCPKHPLVGESPITAAMAPTATGMMINAHMASFFANMSRPSGILRHPGRLDEAAMTRIKKKFMEITQRGHSGEPIVLQENMDWTALTMTAVDAAIIESYKLSERQVFQVYRVPMALVGDGSNTTMQSSESLMRFYTSSALGFYVNHVEKAFMKLFNTPPNEVIEFDVEGALLRGDMESRMNSYAKAIQNAVMTPNEARSRESLPPDTIYGDDLRAQQQLVPLSYGAQLQPPGATGGDDPPPPPAEPEPEPEPTEEQRIAASIIAKRAIQKAMEPA